MAAGAILYIHGRIQHFIPYTHIPPPPHPPTAYRRPYFALTTSTSQELQRARVSMVTVSSLARLRWSSSSPRTTPNTRSLATLEVGRVAYQRPRRTSCEAALVGNQPCTSGSSQNLPTPRALEPRARGGPLGAVPLPTPPPGPGQTDPWPHQKNPSRSLALRGGWALFLSFGGVLGTQPPGPLPLALSTQRTAEPAPGKGQGGSPRSPAIPGPAAPRRLGGAAPRPTPPPPTPSICWVYS